MYLATTTTMALLWTDAEGKTISQLIGDLGIPSERVFNVLVNHFPSKPNHVVKNGDVVTSGDGFRGRLRIRDVKGQKPSWACFRRIWGKYG